MEFVKEAKVKLGVMALLIILMLLSILIYFSTININYKRGYDVSAPELVL